MRRKRGGREGRGQRSGAGVAAMGEGWDDSGGSLHLGCEVVVDGGFWCGLMRRMVVALGETVVFVVSRGGDRTAEEGKR